MNLKGAKILSKVEQKSINGGLMVGGGHICIECTTNSDCATGVCITYSGKDCDKTACGCGKFC